MGKDELYKLRKDLTDQMDILKFSPDLSELLGRCVESVTGHINCVEHLERRAS